jgi:hypothetical protein
MTGTTGSSCIAKTMQRFTGAQGINASLGSVTSGGPTPYVNPAQIRAGNFAAELAERSSTVQYPTVNVYCEKIVNALTEKFQRFSGAVQMAVEIRHSQDGLNGLESALEMYADAVMETLNQSRGDWGDGMYYSGAYQVTFGPVKHGGKNFVQAAKVSFEIGVGIQ